MRKKNHWPVIYGFVLIAFTVYVLLDAFVIPRTYAVVNDTSSSTYSLTAKTVGSVSSASSSSQSKSTSSSSSSSDESQSATQTDTVVTDNSYSDGNISITITTYTVDNTQVYVADITLSSADALKTAFANNTFGKNITQTTSAIAAAHNAILAVNGDYYSARSGYVIRNGVIYRSTSSDSSQEDLVVYSDGSMKIIKEGEITCEELLNDGAVQVLSFGPGLVEDGNVTVSSSDEVGKAMTSNPRTAIGMIDSLHYVMVVSDGRTSESEGLSLYQLATFMQSLGVTTAYNLDGGGSSTMYFNGSVVNNPTTNGTKISERSVSDIVYIG
jgi:exopolysaccharide biosynthesis protein